MARGFDEQSGFYTGGLDHYTHIKDAGPSSSIHGFDWHVNQTSTKAKEYIGKYSGNLVRDDAIDYIQRRANLGAGASPFFLYLPFQEAHSPYQVDQRYKDMYPHLASKPESQALAGMITHTDDMVEDIVQTLKSTGLYENTIIVFSSDNGGIGGQDKLTPDAKPFDDVYIDRNYPFRGQKREVRYGGFTHRFPDKLFSYSLSCVITAWLAPCTLRVEKLCSLRSSNWYLSCRYCCSSGTVTLNKSKIIATKSGLFGQNSITTLTLEIP